MLVGRPSTTTRSVIYKMALEIRSGRPTCVQPCLEGKEVDHEGRGEKNLNLPKEE